MSARTHTFFTAWLQVALITLNTWLIAHHEVIPAILCGFAISFVWTLNVKKVAFGCLADRLTYAFGACSGTATGMLVAGLLR
jgi:hypothetical protein